MPKKIILEELKTLRVIPKEDLNQTVLALEFELIYELCPSNFRHSRGDVFKVGHCLASAKYFNKLREQEYRLYFPGPKLWIKPHLNIRASTEEGHFQFSIQKNEGSEYLVPLLFDNVRLTLDKLNINELGYDSIPRCIKNRAYYKNHGGYERSKLGILHPELRERSLEDSLLKSYKEVDGKLTEKAGLLGILKDYSKIVSNI